MKRFEQRTIEVPAGVQMTRLTDGLVRTHENTLKFKAFRNLDGRGAPADDVWRFYWLGKLYTVQQTEVGRVT